jgi:hypothetical protein
MCAYIQEALGSTLISLLLGAVFFDDNCRLGQTINDVFTRLYRAELTQEAHVNFERWVRN